MRIGLGIERGEEKTVMVYLTYLKAYRKATSVGVKKRRVRLIGSTKGGMNNKLHAICDSQGGMLNLSVTAAQVSDYIGAQAFLNSLSNVDWLLCERSYDADWFKEELKDKGIAGAFPAETAQKAYEARQGLI